jgi:hypothetical protein
VPLSISTVISENAGATVETESCENVCVQNEWTSVVLPTPLEPRRISFTGIDRTGFIIRLFEWQILIDCLKELPVGLRFALKVDYLDKDARSADGGQDPDGDRNDKPNAKENMKIRAHNSEITY